MGDYEKTICELFDNNPSNYQIKAIAGMYNIDIEEVKRILLDNGRALPKVRTAKATIKAANKSKTEPQEAAAKEDTKAAIPDAVKNLVFDKIDKLECELRNLNERINALEDAKAAAVSEYKVLADFINMPFGAGNLSQNDSSHDIAESPQADA